MQATIAAHTPPTTAHLSSALPSSETPCRPNRRVEAGERVHAGEVRRHRARAEIPAAERHRGEQRQRRSARRRSAARRDGAPGSPARAPPSSSRDRASVRASKRQRVAHDVRAGARPAAPPTAISAALPPIMVAKFVSSRERGTWPRSRAWSRRRCDGSSVRSPPFSDSAIRRSAAGAPTEIATAAASALSIRLGDADHDAVEAHHEHEEPAQQRDRESDAEQVELRRRARDHAEREVDDHQRDHRRQRDQQAGLEDPGAPGGHRQQEIARRRPRRRSAASGSCWRARRAAPDGR